MALSRNVKVKFEKIGVDRAIYTETHSNPSVDDIVSFMAQSEAERLYILPRVGIVRDTQTPSDELKNFLRDLV